MCSRRLEAGEGGLERTNGVHAYGTYRWILVQYISVDRWRSVRVRLPINDLTLTGETFGKGVNPTRPKGRWLISPNVYR